MSSNNIRCSLLIRDSLQNNGEPQLASIRAVKEMPKKLQEKWVEAITEKVDTESIEQDEESIALYSFILNSNGAIEMKNDSANPDTEIYSAHYQSLSEVIDALGTDKSTKNLSVSDLASSKDSDKFNKAVTIRLLSQANFTDNTSGFRTKLDTLKYGCIKSVAELQTLLRRYKPALLKFLKDIPVWIRANPYKSGGMLSGIALVVLASATLPILGFSSIGPVAGSIAAGWQASMGSVVAGSLFSFLQSAAMGGAAMGVFAGIGALGGAVVAAAGLASLWGKVGDLVKMIKGFFW